MGVAGPKVLEAVTETMSVRVFGNTAVVTGVYREKGVRDGKPYQQRRRFIDTWVSENGNWVCVAASATPLPR
jgi:ketosteroid isomerase-like protein